MSEKCINYGSRSGVFDDNGDWWTCSDCGDEWPCTDERNDSNLAGDS